MYATRKTVHLNICGGSICGVGQLPASKSSRGLLSVTKSKGSPIQILMEPSDSCHEHQCLLVKLAVIAFLQRESP